MGPTQREQRAVAAISGESDSESDEALEPVETFKGRRVTWGPEALSRLPGRGSLGEASKDPPRRGSAVL
ncbi:unnamed protein product [Effrenium voratum]|nr:unnamed protein product [Effrenium voratum]